jgi:hypothetical protein
VSRGSSYVKNVEPLIYEFNFNENIEHNLEKVNNGTNYCKFCFTNKMALIEKYQGKPKSKLGYELSIGCHDSFLLNELYRILVGMIFHKELLSKTDMQLLNVSGDGILVAVTEKYRSAVVDTINHLMRELSLAYDEGSKPNISIHLYN